ncbi:MAG: sigma-54-dependent transcriptional regulator [Myxococcota bacterium]
MSERILIAEDEEVIRVNLAEVLEKSGYSVDSVADGDSALEKVVSENYALVIADIHMPGMDGIELLKRTVRERPETFVVIITAYASIETAVESLRLGAYDYIVKPIVFEDLVKTIENLFSYRAVKAELLRLRRDLSDRLGFEGIVGESPAMRDVFALVERVAPSRATVLVTGESGTGKELIARAIHARSGTAEREFLAVNMAALPRELIEAQLFGHEQGAFTGADRHRDGLLRSVSGGTVFLDEIGEIPLDCQAKLLRAVEAQEVLPVGAERPVRARFRLIAATNRELLEAVRTGEFREDLYYRLNVVRIELPPLRERREDIPALVSHFVKLHGRARGRQEPRVSNGAMKLLMSYPFPGNVRELSNVIERACILSDDQRIDVEELPRELLETESMPTGLKAAVEAFERSHIAWVLRAAGGNRERAAKMLEIDPATLYRRLAKYQTAT